MALLPPFPTTKSRALLPIPLGLAVPASEGKHQVAPARAALQRLGSRVIEPAAAKNPPFAITVDGSETIGVIVSVDLKRGALAAAELRTHPEGQRGR